MLGAALEEVLAPAPIVVDRLAVRVRNSLFQFLERFITAPLPTPEEIALPAVRSFEQQRIFYSEQIARLCEEPEWATFLLRWDDWAAVDEFSALRVESAVFRFGPACDQALRELILQHFPGCPRETARRPRGRTCDPVVVFARLPKALTVRSLRASMVGCLCSISGTVTRTSQVRPELLVGVFKCNDCGAESGPIEQHFRYTEPPRCSNAECANTRYWTLCPDAAATRFGDWQKLRVQENANEIPVGCMPRTLEIVARGDAVESAKPGDRIVVTGTPIVVPEVAKLLSAVNRREVQRTLSGAQRAMGEDGAGGARDGATGGMEGATGLKVLGVRDLNYRLCFLASVICDPNGDARRMMFKSRVVDDEDAALLEGPATDDKRAQFTPAEIETVRRMRHRADNEFLGMLVKCVAPNIFSHELVKLGLLLQMIGGVPKRTLENIALRGDINVCIIGDPSTAKSHFLKWVSTTMPRGVYTSGKASSASGLTASITRDGDTGERTIEAGALMLADHGICCIDEFDKMDVRDQVAIHEAMEQQTISIAKAGIKATLNARASLLAALNPIGGKYDRRKPLQRNVAMSAPIMSRFDLMFCIVDDAGDEADRELAHRIVSLHRSGEDAAPTPYQIQDVQLYIRYARSLKPRLSNEATLRIVHAYRELRTQDALANRSKVFRVTTRLLESIIRLSEATAKLFLCETIGDAHVHLALEVMKGSLTTVDMTQVELVDEFAAASAAAGTGDAAVAEGAAAGAASPAAAADGSAADGGAKTTAPKKGRGKTKDDGKQAQQSQQQPQQQGQQSQAQQQQRRLVVTAQEYNAIANRIKAFVHQRERRGPADGSGAPTVDEIIREMLSMSQVNDVAILERECRLIKLVIPRLVQGGELLQVASTTRHRPDAPVTEGEVEERPIIRIQVHPDYDPSG